MAETPAYNFGSWYRSTNYSAYTSRSMINSVELQTLYNVLPKKDTLSLTDGIAIYGNTL